MSDSLLLLTLGVLFIVLSAFSTARTTAICEYSSETKVLQLSLTTWKQPSGEWLSSFTAYKTVSNSSQKINLDLDIYVKSFDDRNLLKIRGAIKENYSLPDGKSTAGANNSNIPASNSCEDVMGDKYFTRVVWNATPFTNKLDAITHPVEFVFISDGSDRCSNSQECVARVQYIQANKTLDANFYIGGDGTVIEGRGWDMGDHTWYGGFGGTSIRVDFLGRYQTDLPSQSSINALHQLASMGLCLGKLSPKYKILSHRQFDGHESIPGDKLDQQLRKWDHFSEDIILEADKSQARHFPLVFREDWEAKEANRTYDALSLPIRYVVVCDGGTRCFTAQGCMRRIQVEQNPHFCKYCDLRDNFYVGDDGYAYEGRGWDVSASDNFKGINKTAISVVFMGHFDRYLPSSVALAAMKKLLKLGLWLQKLSPDFKIISFRKFYDDKEYLGDMLLEEMKKWERYSDEV